MDQSAEQLFTEIKDDLKSLADLKFELIKLKTYDRFSRVVAVVFFTVLVIVMFFSFILFLFLALGFFLGNLLNDMAFGFVLVAGLYLLMGFLVIAFRKQVQRIVMNIVIGMIMNHKEENEEDEKDESVERIEA